MLRESNERPCRGWLSSLVMAASITFLFAGCGGMEDEPGEVGTLEQSLVKKHVLLAGPGTRSWGGWDCQPGYEDADCPSISHPGCTVGDVDSGNCVCPWPDYCMPFFD